MKKQPKVVKGIPEVISSRKISAMQPKKFCGKSCRVYATRVLEAAGNDTPRLECFHVGQGPRISREDDAATRIVEKEVFQSKYVPVGSTILARRRKMIHSDYIWV